MKTLILLVAVAMMAAEKAPEAAPKPEPLSIENANAFLEAQNAALQAQIAIAEAEKKVKTAQDNASAVVAKGQEEVNRIMHEMKCEPLYECQITRFLDDKGKPQLGIMRPVPKKEGLEGQELRNAPAK